MVLLLASKWEIRVRAFWDVVQASILIICLSVLGAAILAGLVAL
jgi:hypothetical protein